MKPPWAYQPDSACVAQTLDLSALPPGAHELGALGLDLSRVLDGEACTVAYTFRALSDLMTAAASLAQVWLLSGTFHAPGDFGFYWDTAGSVERTFWPGVTLGVTFGQSGFAWTSGDVVTLVVWRDARRMDIGVYGIVNGEVRFRTATASGSPGGSATRLGPPSALWVNSDLGSTPQAVVQPLSFSVLYQHAQVGPPAAGILVGDSIQSNIASGSTETRAGLASFLRLPAGVSVVNLAIGGSTIAQMLTSIWTPAPPRWKTSGALRWVGVLGAINSANTGSTTGEMLTDMQALVAQVATDAPQARIYLLEGTPCRGFLSAPHWAEYDAYRQALLAGAVPGTTLVAGYYDLLCTSPGSGFLAGPPVGFAGGVHQMPAGSATMARVFDAVRHQNGDP